MRVGVEPLRTSATQINFQVQKLLAFWLGSTSRARPCKTVMRRNNFCCLNVYININRPAWRAVIFGSFSGFGTITLLIYIADVLIIRILSTVEYFVIFPCFSGSFHTDARLEFSKTSCTTTMRDFSGFFLYSWKSDVKTQFTWDSFVPCVFTVERHFFLFILKKRSLSVMKHSYLFNNWFQKFSIFNWKLEDLQMLDH